MRPSTRSESQLVPGHTAGPQDLGTRPRTLPKSDWLTPLVGWLFLGGGLLLAFTPLFPLNWVAGLVATVLVYNDRKALGLPAFWWPFGVFCLGPFVFIFYVYARRGHAAQAEPSPLASATAAQELPPAARPAGSSDALERLERLAKLRDSGGLTDDEFAAQKVRLLDELNRSY